MLGDVAEARFAALSGGNQNPHFSEHQREEFPSWMSGSGDPDYSETLEIDIAPLLRRELVEWLKKPPRADFPFYDDTWRKTCREYFPQSLTALCQLARQNEWPIDRWIVALQVWSEEGRVLRSWRRGASLVLSMPDDVIERLSHNVSWWAAEVAKSLRSGEERLLALSRRLLALEYPIEPATTDPVGRAINHPVGHVTNALLSRWFDRKPGDGDLLPVDLEPLLTLLFNASNSAFRNGRVILASNAIALYRVDRVWTEKNLLPCFSWKADPVEAAALWHGFLWSPRLYQDLMLAFKADFLDTVHHYAELGDHATQYAIFLTYAGLDIGAGYTPADFRVTIESLPREGLVAVARALSQAQEGAAEHREEYWDSRVTRFLHDIWPKAHELKSPAVADSFARLAIAAGGKFHEALRAVEDWLMPIEHPDYVVHLLYQAKLCGRFPRDALALLHATINNQQFAPRDLLSCLSSIRDAEASLSSDARFQRLSEFMRGRAI